jgi:deoxycytidylate deaminase
MSTTDYDSVEAVQRNAELVFGLVAPMGTDSMMVAENLVSHLNQFHTQSEIIRLSDFIAPYSDLIGIPCELKNDGEFERISSRIAAANDLYRAFNERADVDEKNALLALAAAHHIWKRRTSQSSGEALLDHASILVTLKRPEEIHHLRRIYGTGLHVIGVFATEEERLRFLTGKKHISKDKAQLLVQEDADDKQEGGQRAGDAFHLADVFLDIGRPLEDWKGQLGRYLDLLFSHPYETPTRDEQAMFFAYAASLRSAQLGRQVGAAITTDDGDILAVGCNEVPKAGGGQYWARDPVDERDHVKGHDSNDFRKNEILGEILQLLPEELRQNDELKKKIRKTSLFSITEFGRAMHAEMEAILSCGRKGISPVGRTLYTTTFPCHNCARHIIGAGIKRVVYVEPYPKSKAKELHEDAIRLGDAIRKQDAQFVAFDPFVGISPRKYLDMFTINPVYSAQVDRKLSNGHAINWKRDRTPLKTKMASLSYIEREMRAVSRLDRSLEQRVLNLTEPSQKVEE